MPIRYVVSILVILPVGTPHTSSTGTRELLLSDPVRMHRALRRRRGCEPDIARCRKQVLTADSWEPMPTRMDAVIAACRRFIYSELGHRRVSTHRLHQFRKCCNR